MLFNFDQKQGPSSDPLIRDTNPQSFSNDVIEASKTRLVLVDFWAPWCGPCRMMAPTFAQAASEMEPFARFAKLDTEAEQQLAARFNIRSIPTLAIFKNGREIARQSGALDLGSLQRWLQPHLYKI